MTDLLVAGGGPAGLATALYAARAGLSVIVRDPRAGVIDKACGEGLMPGALSALTDLHVDPEGHPITGIRYVAGGRCAEARFRHGPGRGVRRTVLHAAMREAVIEAGATIEHKPVVDVQQDATGVTADGTRAGHLVAADGLHSALRRRLELDRPPSRFRRFGLRRHYAMRPWTSYVEVHWSDVAEAYVTPVAADLVGIAVLTATRGSFDEHIRRFPGLLERLADARPVGDVMGAGPLRQHARAQVAGRVLLVGDAAGYVDALTGEGVALAMRQARAAVDAVVAGQPERYLQEWRALSRRYRLMTSSLVNVTRLAPVRRAIVPAAERLPGLFATAVHTLARP
jgi:flavin-dependent dehydrogenase